MDYGLGIGIVETRQESNYEACRKPHDLEMVGWTSILQSKAYILIKFRFGSGVGCPVYLMCLSWGSFLCQATRTHEPVLNKSVMHELIHFLN